MPLLLLQGPHCEQARFNLPGLYPSLFLPSGVFNSFLIFFAFIFYHQSCNILSLRLVYLALALTSALELELRPHNWAHTCSATQLLRAQPHILSWRGVHRRYSMFFETWRFSLHTNHNLSRYEILRLQPFPSELFHYLWHLSIAEKMEACPFCIHLYITCFFTSRWPYDFFPLCL